MKIDDLVLTVRVANTLNNADITTVEQLLQSSPRELIMSRNFGRKSWADLLLALRKAGIPEIEIQEWTTQEWED